MINANYQKREYKHVNFIRTTEKGINMEIYQVMTNTGFVMITVTSEVAITRSPPTEAAPTPDLPRLLQKPPVLSDPLLVPLIDDPSFAKEK